MFHRLMQSSTRKQVSRFLISVAALGFAGPAASIVNMDVLHFDERQEGMSATIGFALSGASGNSESLNTALDAQFSWARPRHINLLLLGANYGETNDVRSANNAFVHARHIHRYTETIDWELFAQLEKDEFTRLTYRGLLGAGTRYAVANTQRHKAFLGTGAFLSEEKIEDEPGLTDEGVERLVRGNIYWFSRYRLSATANFSNALYYQPALDDLPDYRTLLQSTLSVDISKTLRLRLSLDARYDSKPSQTVEETDLVYTSGIEYKF